LKSSWIVSVIRHWNLDRKTEEPVRDVLVYNDPKLTGNPELAVPFTANGPGP